MSLIATPEDASATANVCVPNIGRHQRQMRLRIGIAVLSLGALVGAALVFFGVALPWRLAAFVPLWAGATSVFQVREKTCVALAARGVRNLDHGEEAITEPGELRQIRRQARRVRLQGLALAGLLTLGLLALP